MNKLNEKYVEVLENHNWRIMGYVEDTAVELEKYSPAGEDFLVCVEIENFSKAMVEYAEAFDIDEHVTMWIEAKSQGVKGIPSCRELVQDAEEIEKMLNEIVAALTSVDNEYWSVIVTSEKHGGELHTEIEGPVLAPELPEDRSWETDESECKQRYFKSRNEAKEVVDKLNRFKITIQRRRMSVTQGDVDVFVNGTHVITFCDDIVLVPGDSNKNDYYGDNITRWRSSKPDSSFALGIIWNPYDYIYHHSEMICKKLGIERSEWIEREVQLWNVDGD